MLLVDGDDTSEVSIDEALKRAEEKSLDLVEVSPLSSPPVCKIMDYGTYLYSQKKKDRKQKKASKQTETKTIRLSIRTGMHDLEVKAKKAKKFLEDRNTVKVVVIFKGREMAHGDLAEGKLREFHTLLEDISSIEQEPRRQGYQMTMILNPSK
ncbi:translation initiation factor IF-3 [Candidatus Peregrinibacteria bacterium]|nr:translation initiation factor IF-3 [Candidatus Peregrinibacteria bacterium]